MPERAKEVSPLVLPTQMRGAIASAMKKLQKEGEFADVRLFEVLDVMQERVIGYLVGAIASGEPDWQGAFTVGFTNTGKKLYNDYEDRS
jgi:hypothetical protein